MHMVKFWLVTTLLALAATGACAWFSVDNQDPLRERAWDKLGLILAKATVISFVTFLLSAIWVLI